jgi:transposase
MAVTRAEKIATAQQMREGGALLREIGEALGVTTSAVSKWLDPEKAREWNRLGNAKRGPAKRAEENRLDGRPCPECGAPRKRGCARRATLCRDCRRRLIHEARVARRGRIGEMWRAGASRRAIAAALQSTPQSIGVEIARMRGDGWDLPYRRKSEVAA